MKDICFFYIFLSMFFLTFTKRASAQILNVEKFRLRADTSNVFLGNFGVGFSAKKQKNDVLDFSAEGDLVYLSAKHSYKFLSELNLIKISDEDAISEGYLHLRLNLFRKAFLSLEQFNQLQYDVGRGLKQRALTGAVARVSAVSNEKMELSFNAGPMYEWEIWEEGGEDSAIENKFWKVSSNVLFRATITEHLGFVTITYYQTRFKKFFKPRITSDAQLIFRFSDRFSFGLSYSATYDAAPVIDIAEFISEFGTTANLNF